MAQQNREPTKEEIEQKKSQARDHALKNLKVSNLLNLAIAYSASREESGFGKTANQAVDQFLYSPAMNSETKVTDLASGNQYDFLRNSLSSSREDGEPYSGHLTEKTIIKSASTIVQQSLGAVKVSDILSLIGSNVPINEAYKDKYLADLYQSENPEDKNLVNGLIGGYMGYITTKGVAKALESRASSVRGGLEELVRAPAQAA